MAYKPENLSVLSYANGFTLWHYRTTDNTTDVDTSGYFNAAAKMIRPGDFIFINAGLGGTPSHGIMVILSNADGVVNASNVLAFGSVDTD
jgi:hypothetical protein